MLNTQMFHLGLKTSDLERSTFAILPGDPDRVKKIALFMEDPKHLSSCREFTTWSAKINNKTVIICSTGIGGPSTSIVIEELSQLGIRTFLRVGTAGSIQPHVNTGEMLVITAAVRNDGASRHFAPLEFPAVSDLSISTALVQAAKKINIKKLHTGIVVSSDTFYPGQERKDTYSGYIIKNLQGSMQEWKNLGIIGYEMESATLFTMCATQKLRAGSIVGIIINRTQKDIPDKKLIKQIENTTIKVAIEATKILLNT